MKTYFYGIIGCTLFLSTFSTVVEAHIPRAKFILSKTAENHGKGVYQIEQEVVISSGQTQMTVIEEWFIQDGSAMTLNVRGNNLQLSYIYKDGKKYFLDKNKSENAISTGKEFLDPLFYFRSGEALGSAIVGLQFAGKEILQGEPNVNNLSNVKHRAEENVYLARFNNATHFAFGKPPVAATTAEATGVFVEQDKFVIRKIRTQQKSELLADDYAEFSKGFWLPKTRSLKWDGGTATVQLTRVKALGENAEKDRFAPTNIRGGKVAACSNIENATVEEFYRRFR